MVASRRRINSPPSAYHIEQFEQGRLIQGHHVNPFRESLGRFSQSLTRWPLTVPDRHTVTPARKPIYTTRRDSPAGRSHGWPMATRLGVVLRHWRAALPLIGYERAR